MRIIITAIFSIIYVASFAQPTEGKLLGKWSDPIIQGTSLYFGF